MVNVKNMICFKLNGKKCSRASISGMSFVTCLGLMALLTVMPILTAIKWTRSEHNCAKLLLLIKLRLRFPTCDPQTPQGFVTGS